MVQFYVEDETRPENTHLMGSVLAEGDLNSRFSLSSLKETVAFGLLKYRMKMELKPFPQLFQKRKDSDLAGGGIPTHSRPSRVFISRSIFLKGLGCSFLCRPAPAQTPLCLLNTLISQVRKDGIGLSILPEPHRILDGSYRGVIHL